VDGRTGIGALGAVRRVPSGGVAGGTWPEGSGGGDVSAATSALGSAAKIGSGYRRFVDFYGQADPRAVADPAPSRPCGRPMLGSRNSTAPVDWAPASPVAHVSPRIPFACSDPRTDDGPVPSPIPRSGLVALGARRSYNRLILVDKSPSLFVFEFRRARPLPEIVSFLETTLNPHSRRDRIRERAPFFGSAWPDRPLG